MYLTKLDSLALDLWSGMAVMVQSLSRELSFFSLNTDIGYRQFRVLRQLSVCHDSQSGGEGNILDFRINENKDESSIGVE